MILVPLSLEEVVAIEARRDTLAAHRAVTAREVVGVAVAQVSL